MRLLGKDVRREFLRGRFVRQKVARIIDTAPNLSSTCGLVHSRRTGLSLSSLAALDCLHDWRSSVDRLDRGGRRSIG